MKKLLIAFVIILSLTLVMSSTCFDTDGGINLVEKGKVSGVFDNGEEYFFRDACTIDDTKGLIEATCVDFSIPKDGVETGDYPNSKQYNCPGDSICVDGECKDTINSCLIQGGICEFPCKEGKIVIGQLDCGENICCKKGDAPSNCLPGTEIPTCLDKDILQQCDPATGYFVQIKNTQGKICKDGEWIDDELADCGCWIEKPLSDKCLVKDLFCIINNFIEGLKNVFSIVVGLLAGLLGIVYGNKYFPKNNKNKYLLLLFIILGVAGGVIAYIYFWWVILALVILSIIKFLIPVV